MSRTVQAVVFRQTAESQAANGRKGVKVKIKEGQFYHDPESMPNFFREWFIGPSLLPADQCEIYDREVIYAE